MAGSEEKYFISDNFISLETLFNFLWGKISFENQLGYRSKNSITDSISQLEPKSPVHFLLYILAVTPVPSQANIFILPFIQFNKFNQANERSSRDSRMPCLKSLISFKTWIYFKGLHGIEEV